MNAYQLGFHAYLYPATAEPPKDEDAADYWEGWNAAKEIDEQVKAKPTLTAILTSDGLIDMFIMGADGIPVAHLEKPTATGEDAERLAREYLASLQEGEDA